MPCQPLCGVSLCVDGSTLRALCGLSACGGRAALLLKHVDGHESHETGIHAHGWNECSCSYVSRWGFRPTFRTPSHSVLVVVNPRNRAELRVAGQPPVPRNRTSARVARAFAIRFPDRIHTPRTGGGQHMPPPPERKETPPSPPSHCPPSSPPAAAVTRVESRPTPAVDCGVDGTHLPSSKRKRSAPGSRACLTRLPGPGLRGLTPTPHTPRLSRPALPPTHPHLHKTTVTG